MVILIYLSVAWMAGLYLSWRIDLPLALWGWISLLPLCVTWLWWREPRVRRAALCGLFVLLGAMRHRLAQPRLDERSVAAYNDQGWATLVGVVIAEPDVRDTYTNLRLRAERLTLEEGRPIEVEGMVLVRVPRYPARQYGERLEVRGELETPPVFEAFSYRDYLARQGIHSMVRWAQTTTLERDRANRLFALLLGCKGHTQEVIADILPEPCASLLTGILLGVEGGIPADLYADFRTTGTSHIIAISGFNMALVGGLFSSLSVRLIGRRYAAWFATTAMALYTLFVGASAAVVRAAVMSAIAVWGEHFGRQNSAPNALLATALLMTAWNPHTLWDLGFLLSFAATLGLVLLADPFQRGLEGSLARLLPVRWVEPASKFLYEPLVLTTCAQLTTMPILVYSFRELSPVTLLSNALILPLQTQVMLWGAAATAGGLIWLPLGRVLGWVAWLFLGATIWGVETTARLPHAAVYLGSVSPAFVCGWYAALGVGVWLLGQREEKRRATWRALRRAVAPWFSGRPATRMLVGGLAMVAVLVWLAVAALPDGQLHVTFLDVGEGDATLIETPGGQQILINGGPSPARIMAHLGRRMPFWDRTLDLVVLTDDRDEHLAGLVPVLERYQVSHVLNPARACTRSACAPWQERVREEGVVAQQAVAGMRADLGGGSTLTVLHPAGGRSTENDAAVVLRVDYGQTCFLLAGSADQEAQVAMLARGENVRCDVLQMGQRGERGAVHAAFLEAVRPGLIVLAGEEEGQAGSAGGEAAEPLHLSGATLVGTGQRGGVEVVSDGVGYDVRVRP